MDRFDKLMNILDFATDPTGALTNRARGSAVLLGRLGKNAGKLMRPFNKICRQKKKSFTASTLVHTERGLIRIEEVKIGEKVLSYEENTKKNQWNEVVNLIQGEQEYTIVTLTLENGELIEATANHPFYIQGKGWNPANRLKVGQALQLRNGTTVVIEEISTQVRHEKVYNLTVANAHTYFVGEDGVLVHNNEKYEYCDIDNAKRQAEHLVLQHVGRNRRKSKDGKHQQQRTVSAAFHIVTGDFKYATSGDRCKLQDVHHSLVEYISKQTGLPGYGVKNPHLERFHAMGDCAEFQAANKILNYIEKTNETFLAHVAFVQWVTARYEGSATPRDPCTYCNPLIEYANSAREALRGHGVLP